MTNDPGIVRKVGEGTDRPQGENELPIDINYRKLAEWLVGRQKLPNDWHKRLAAIQQKMHEAVKEVPAETLAQVKGGSDGPLDYLKAKAISSLLSATAERTMFGGLTGPAAVWDKIVKAYEKGYVWMGEAAQLMLQNVDYEIPYLQKQAAKLDSQVADCERKHAEYLKSAAQCAAAYKQDCAKLGIEGRSLRTELGRLTSEQLPKKFSSVVDILKGEEFDKAVEYYSAFTATIHGDGAVPGVLLPNLREVHLGTTEAPKQVSGSADEPKTADVSIDWDVIDMGTELGGDAAPGDIDWGISAEVGDAGAEPTIEWDLDMDMVVVEEGAGEEGVGEGASAAPEVSWDIDMSVAEGGDGAKWEIDMTETGAGTAPVVDIDWDIDPEDVEAEALQQKESLAVSGVKVEVEDGAAGAGSGSAEWPAAVMRLERDAEYRSSLLDDLQELRAFLLQRHSDLSSSSSLLSTVIPEAMQSVDITHVSAWLRAVSSALAELASDQLRQLLLIATSKRYLERLVNNLQRKAGQEAKMLAASKEVEARQRESKASLVALSPKVKELVSRTRELKVQVEQTLSGLFAGRIVNVLGEINTVLSQAA